MKYLRPVYLDEARLDELPPARVGSIEVRPVRVFSEADLAIPAPALAESGA